MIRFVLLAAALLVRACLPAYAQKAPDVPPIKLDAVMLEENGKPAQDCDTPATATTPPKDCVPLTLRRAAAHALFYGRYPGEENLAGDIRWARGRLAERIRDEPNITLSVEEIAVVKKLMGRFYSPLVVAQAYEILDPGAMPPAIQ
jgi:hypothetical protein